MCFPSIEENHDFILGFWGLLGEKKIAGGEGLVSGGLFFLFFFVIQFFPKKRKFDQFKIKNCEKCGTYNAT